MQSSRHGECKATPSRMLDRTGHVELHVEISARASCDGPWLLVASANPRLRALAIIARLLSRMPPFATSSPHHQLHPAHAQSGSRVSQKLCENCREVTLDLIRSHSPDKGCRPGAFFASGPFFQSGCIYIDASSSAAYSHPTILSPEYYNKFSEC